MKKLLLPVAIACAITASAQDTFSICAVDTVTGEVGSAGASCIDAIQIGNQIGCALISDVHPGVGVVHTQAYYITPNQIYAQGLMQSGHTPQQIMDSVQANDAQNNPAIRQYGAVRLNGNSAQSAAFTGSNCMAYANHRVGPNYAIQGNILLSAAILDSMEARFLNTQGSLACKLMAAMQGANVPGADTRCMNSGNSSLSSFLRVADASGMTIDLVVPSGPTGFEPIDSLQTLFDNVQNCPVGINENVFRLGVSVVPNPANDFIDLRFTQMPGSGTTFELFDTRGILVMRKPVDAEEQIRMDISALAAGTYYYKVSVPQGGSASGKVIVQ